jgi:hydrogenase maturation protease
MNGLTDAGSSAMKTVIIGLGNTILTDDGAGVYVARDLSARLAGTGTDIIETESAGMNLMEMLDGHERAVLVDAIALEGVEPGTVFRLSPDDLRITPRLASCHDIDIVTALELGRRLGLSMPSEVVIFAVQGADMLTLGEIPTPAVADVIPLVADEIETMLFGKDAARVSIPLSERKCDDA